MSPLTKWLIVLAVILTVPTNSYYVGSIIDDYCWYGHTIYLGSDNPSKCLTQAEHDEMFTGEFWDENTLTDIEQMLVDDILIDQINRFDLDLVCDYGYFQDEIKCLVIQERVTIFDDRYTLADNTRSGAMFDSDGELVKLKGEHPNGYTHDGNDFTFKTIGSKYYLITQEPIFGNYSNSKSQNFSAVSKN